MPSSYIRSTIQLFICCLATFTSTLALADNTLFTAMDDPANAQKPFEGNFQAGYNAQSGNSQNSRLLARTNMTWFDNDAAYSLWGSANNATSSNVRSSEKYQAGVRTRYNLNDLYYLFGQASWLSDRFNGYDSSSILTLTSGYGHQILNGPVSDLRVEFGPGVRYDKYHGRGRSTKALAYGAANYSYQLTDSTKITQGISALINEAITLNSETALNVAINEKLSLRVAYTLTYNRKPTVLAPKSTDTTTSVTLVYGL
ncbi:MAG: DUF481 domain-containing protein [Serratia symbiotica]|nr:DUF481 domain-containing protein [Serratia symbiotica]